MSLWRFTGHKGRRVVDVTRKSSLQKSQKDNHVDVGCKPGQKNGKRHHAGSTQTHQLASFSICQIAPIRRNNGLSKISNRKCQSGIKIDFRPAVMAETFNVKSHKRHCHRKTKSSYETPYPKSQKSSSPRSRHILVNQKISLLARYFQLSLLLKNFSISNLLCSAFLLRLVFL